MCEKKRRRKRETEKERGKGVPGRGVESE